MKEIEFKLDRFSDLDLSNGWECIWRSHLLLCLYSEDQGFVRKALKARKFNELKKTLTLSSPWTELARQDQVVSDALLSLRQGDDICLCYKDSYIVKEALTGLFHLVQFCRAKCLDRFYFKILLRKETWNSLTFDNKSHVVHVVTLI